MAQETTKKVAFIASYLPRKCGIATFTSDLITNTTLAAGDSFIPLVVAMRSDPSERYHRPVQFEIRQQIRSDYASAADFLNFSHVDLVSVQHEFGLFGGEAGSYLTGLLKRLKAPIVTTLHTVLEDPDESYRRSMQELCDCSTHLITMNERGIDMLRDIYDISGDHVCLIPHGIPDLPFVDSNYYKHKFGLDGRRTILTFGLLGKNKGIENMIQALPEIIKADPSVMYMVLGMTHPNVLKLEGEAYRFSLQRQVKRLGLDQHVRFYNRFVEDEELHNVLCAADLYVTPYVNREQLTSGTLAFAVGTGKAVVSTPYWAAEELLTQNRGQLVPFQDPQALGQAIVRILQDDVLFYGMRRRAYDYGRERTWPRMGEAYWECFQRIMSHMGGKVTSTSSLEPATTTELPDPNLDHLIRLTDDTGLFQHAEFTLAQRRHGYCTDDNARAVILMTRYHAQYPDPQSRHLLDTYLSFILHAQNEDGTVRNFMNFDRTWHKDEPANDALGRFLWALGTVMTQPPASPYVSIAKEYFDRSCRHIQKQYPRGMAYAILGLCDYLEQFPGASDIKRALELAADGLVRQYDENHSPDWPWFEDILTYDNAVLPHALFAASKTLNHPRYLEVALVSSQFLIETCLSDTIPRLIGCQGWYERGGQPAAFDQQPIDAASLVLMLKAAYESTQDRRYLTLQRKAFDWFLGINDLHTPLYDFRTTGCHDGLTANGPNLNQGAESTISFLLSLLDVLDVAALHEKPETEPPILIKEILTKNKTTPTPVEELNN